MSNNNPFIKNGKLYGQDFEQIKVIWGSEFRILSFVNLQASSLRGGSLFQDDHFPPSARSVYYSRDPQSVSSYLTWLRPNEICEEPELYVDGADRHDINQVPNKIIQPIRDSTTG